MTLPGPLRRLLHFTGIDRAVGYTLAGSGLARLAGPLQLLIVAGSLDKAEQGVYYSFANLLGLQVFFDLGIGTVLVQFVSHERAGLEWNDAGQLIGDPTAKGRMAAVLRLAIKWYGVAAMLVALMVVPAGWYFFATSEGADRIAWQVPWVLAVLASAGTMAVMPFQVLPTGCGLVAETARLQIWQTAATYLAAWTTFALGGKLLAIPAASFASLAVCIAGLRGPGRLRSCLADLLHTPTPAHAISWWREIWPFQWRIALSWLSGYFIFQLFVPVLFRYRGAVVAGQMGMSLSLLTSLGQTAMSWVNTKMPEAGRLIARREFAALDALFLPAALRSVGFVVLTSSGLVGVVGVLQYIGRWPGDRFLPVYLLGVLAVVTIVNQIVFAEAAYLRAHKQEPFLLLSIVAGVLIALGTYFLGRAYGAAGILSAYFAVSVFVSLGGGTVVFLAKRRQWHSEGTAWN
ncbi:MAG: hypothetical protein U0746_02160 [Gemmataceae bacterium]